MKTINLFAAIQLNPTISTRQLERECELSRRLILKVLHKNKFHTYHIQLHQNLEKRFCKSNEFLQYYVTHDQRRSNYSFTYPIFRVLFEANFCNEQVNRHSMHYWAVENPY